MNGANYLRGKNILVTGGTGSFGHQIVSQLVKLEPSKIVIFSRDEKKQYDMKNEFKEYADLLEFIIGDVRDYAKVWEATKGIYVIYHAAALKQVPNCEFNPLETVKTNVLGAENVRLAAIKNGVEIVVAISTDKAVKPVNVMGMTKAIQERIMLNPSNRKWDTKFICVRYGNVIGSRGSVIPLFKQLLEKGEPLMVTHPKMTRFLLTLEEAIDLVFKATAEAEGGQLFVRKMPACYIMDLAKAMAKAISGRENYPIVVIGIRPGEKIHEVLVSEEEMHRAVESEKHYVIYPQGRKDKVSIIGEFKEYTSNNTQILNQKEIVALLKKENWA